MSAAISEADFARFQANIRKGAPKPEIAPPDHTERRGNWGGLTSGGRIGWILEDGRFFLLGADNQPESCEWEAWRRSVPSQNFFCCREHAVMAKGAK